MLKMGDYANINIAFSILKKKCYFSFNIKSCAIGTSVLIVVFLIKNMRLIDCNLTEMTNLLNDKPQARDF